MLRGPLASSCGHKAALWTGSRAIPGSFASLNKDLGLSTAVTSNSTFPAHIKHTGTKQLYKCTRGKTDLQPWENLNISNPVGKLMSSPRKSISFGGCWFVKWGNVQTFLLVNRKHFAEVHSLGFVPTISSHIIFLARWFPNTAAPEFKARGALWVWCPCWRDEGGDNQEMHTWLKALIQRILSLSLPFPQIWTCLKNPRTTLLDDPKQKHFCNNAVWMYKRVHFWKL